MLDQFGRITLRESFEAMSDYLANFEPIGSRGEELGDFLSTVAITECGEPVQPAAFDAWISSVERASADIAARKDRGLPVRDVADAVARFGEFGSEYFGMGEHVDLTVLEGFLALTPFVRFFDEHGGVTLATLGMDVHLLSNGLPVDLASWDDWGCAVQAVRAG